MDTLAQILQFLQNLVYRDTSGKPYVKVSIDNFSEINPEIANIDSNIESINTNTTSSYAELQSIHNRQNNGQQKTQIIPTATPTALAITESAVESNGSTAADNLYITFVTSEDFVGSINGITIPKLAVKDYPYLPGHKYPSIAYLITTGTLYIVQAK